MLPILKSTYLSTVLDTYLHEQFLFFSSGTDIQRFTRDKFEDISGKRKQNNKSV